MNATFVLDRSHSARICPVLSTLPFPSLPKPFSPESLVRCSGCAPPCAHQSRRQPRSIGLLFFGHIVHFLISGVFLSCVKKETSSTRSSSSSSRKKQMRRHIVQKKTPEEEMKKHTISFLRNGHSG